jgi:predicted MPP superfamily phosphohydrolase
MPFTRRQFLGVTAGAAGAAAGFYGWRIEPHMLEVVRRPLPVRGLPRDLSGLTLAQISDIHVGPRVDDDYVLDVFARVRALAPDIVAVTGDLVSHHDGMFEQMERVYAQFPRGRIATVGILGNHDYGAGWSHPEMAQRVAEIAASHGIRILRNEILDIGGLQVVGMDDLWARRFDPSAAFARVEPSRAALVLSHNPDAVDLPGWDRYTGWILAGHTHGGQCKAPFLPPPLLPVRNRRYTCGEFGLDGGRSMYISRGVGHLIRVRFNVRPEVTLFTLTPEITS